MGYQLVLHPDVERRLASLAQAARAALGDALQGLSGRGDTLFPNGGDSVTSTTIRDATGQRYRIQLSLNPEQRSLHVLALRPDGAHP
jgi:hypothetical protein